MRTAIYPGSFDPPTLGHWDIIQRAEKLVDSLLNLIASRLGLDHDLVLGSRYSLPLLARYLDRRGGHLSGARERDKMLYWYVHTLLWGRYSGSTESVPYLLPRGGRFATAELLP